MFHILKTILSGGKVRQFLSQTRRGQSLVEMAIATPLLLILFVGVFEVGWAIRGYIVLANMNRESTRYAVKTGVLDFSSKDPNAVGYQNVLSHTMASLANQLPLDFGLGTGISNTTVIMSHYVADTRLPCVKYQGGDPKVPYEFDPNCDCSEDDPNDPQWFDRDDLIGYPDHPDFPQYLQTYGISRTSRFAGGDFQAIATEMKLRNNQLNCTVLKTGTAAEMSADNFMVTEVFYSQPQLLGVPFISNRLTDPIPMYGHTVMRIVASRDSDATELVGPTCEVYPITFHEDIFQSLPENTPFDAYEGGGSGNFGWMNWEPGDNSNPYITEELYNPRTSMNDFTGLTPPPGLSPDPDNDNIDLGDWVSGKTGVGNSDPVMDEMEALVGQTIRVPVHDNFSGSGQTGGYHVSHFALITITDVCLPRNSCPGVSGSDKQIKAMFVGFDDDCTGP
jgi:hypothetical protein